MWKDATAMAQAVKSKEVSPKELVETAIATIEQVNPSYNALVSKQYESALERASHMTVTKAPFAGVPTLLKDLGQHQLGYPTTAGSPLFAHFLAKQTDNYVKALEALGFIILGRTNTPEFGFKNISDSQFNGSVNCPLDVKRNAGGSSGGAAAAVLSGMVPLAAASDGGGSIRIPASFNGLIGLKPSRGRMPVGPGSYRNWQGASSSFAITKSMRDTQALFFGMQVCQLESPFPLPLLGSQSVTRPLKIAYCLQSPVATTVSTDARQAVLDLLPHLVKLGHQVVEIDNLPIDGIAAMQAYYMMNSVETASMFEEIEKQLGRLTTRDDMELTTWAIFRSGQKIPAKAYAKLLEQWDDYSAKMWHFHQNFDLLLSPTTNGPAPLHQQFALSPQLQERLNHIDDFSMTEQQELIWEMFADSLAWTPFTQQANLTGQPAISLPTYETAQGLPIGIQVTAAKGNEQLLFQLAKDLEENGLLKIRSL